MTDIAMLNSIQDEAVKCLLEETFTHIKAHMYEGFKALGKENAKLLQVAETRFINNGIIYPPTHIKTIPYGSCIPTLHYSLLGELDIINQSVSEANYHYIKNFFVAVISQSHNGIVLDSLLPVTLVNTLKRNFNSQKFKVLDTGVYGSLQQEPISVTQQAIQDIKQHYQSTITMIQHMLMDKLLLQA